MKQLGLQVTEFTSQELLALTYAALRYVYFAEDLCTFYEDSPIYQPCLCSVRQPHPVAERLPRLFASS